MPIYMDAHIVPGVKAKEVAKAHHQDMMLQEEFGCKCMTYWVDEQRETIFCLVDAADKDAVRNLHNKAHGMVPNKIIEVSSSVVQSFLGRIYDPENVTIEDGLRIFNEASYRFLLLIRTEDHVLLRHQSGQDADNLIKRYHEMVKNTGIIYKGAEAEHSGDDFIFSFTSASGALACAAAVQKNISATDKKTLGLSIALHGGEPVESSNELFGDTLSFARLLSQIISTDQVALSSSVKEMIARETRTKDSTALFSLPVQQEEFLHLLYKTINEHWHNPHFDIPEYCLAMAMSQSQLYRKTVSVTGDSCNILLRNYRLEKAREMLKKKKYSIAQVTFECGFTSPSYFTRCFKNRYSLLPNTYISLLS